MVAVLGMTVATFAEGEKMTGTDNVQAYNITINTSMLGRALKLSEEQLVVVDEINKEFSADMTSVAAADKESRKAMMDEAVKKDLRSMHEVLNRKQYKTYVRILDATITNRGLAE